METFGDDGELPESELAVTGVVHAEQQPREPSQPVTNAEPFALFLDKPDMVGVVMFLMFRSGASL